MTRAREWLAPRFAARACSRLSRLGTMSAILCTVGLTAGARPAQAGINVWTSHGPGTEHIHALALDPVVQSRLYAGTDDNGAFESTDGGDTWSPTGLTQIPVRALAIDPATPTTVYAGTFSPDSGAFRSADGGITWRSVKPCSDCYAVVALAVDPATPTTLYAGGRGVYKSGNGGATWSTLNTGLTDTYVSVLAIDPITPTTLYVGTGIGVFKTTDSGNTWSAINSGLTSLSVYALAIDPTNSTTLYAGTQATSHVGPIGEHGGVFKSVDGGATWSAGGLSNIFWVRALAIDPTAATHLYAGTDSGVFKSSDGGNTWNEFNTGLTNLDVEALAIDPLDPRRLYAGTGAGIFAIEQIEPAPTPAATPTPTAAPAISEGGACAIATKDTGNALWWLLGPTLVLVRVQRRLQILKRSRRIRALRQGALQ